MEQFDKLRALTLPEILEGLIWATEQHNVSYPKMWSENTHEKIDLNSSHPKLMFGMGYMAAINSLTNGRLDLYNLCAVKLGIAQFPDELIETLPALRKDTVQQYIELRNKLLSCEK